MNFIIEITRKLINLSWEAIQEVGKLLITILKLCKDKPLAGVAVIAFSVTIIYVAIKYIKSKF